MTIAQLIEHLKRFDPELPVYMDAHDHRAEEPLLPIDMDIREKGLGARTIMPRVIPRRLVFSW